MKISVYGAGYVGLVTAVCLAKIGHSVRCVDIDEQKISLLQRGECTIYEQQLPELLNEQLNAERLTFTTNLTSAIQQANIHFIATGTPSLADGSADLQQVFTVVGQIVAEATTDCLLVIKSTVPVGTGDAVEQYIKDELGKIGKNLSIDVVSNPEFLREGTAIYDFLCADRIILGGQTEAVSYLLRIYQPLVENKVPFLTMSRRSAELTKYAANAMLACKISFINQISQFAEELDANIDEVREGIALDKRIGPHFIQAGIGYGGSCFPKDVRALIQTAKSVTIDPSLLIAVEEVNSQQKDWIFNQVSRHFAQGLHGLRLGLWGLAFKPGTNDLREASSLVAIDALLASGATLYAFDPVAMPTAQQVLNNESAIHWCASPEAVLNEGLDALLILTEWAIFSEFSLATLQAKLKGAPVFDGRNCFSLNNVASSGLAYYYSVGRPSFKRDVERC